MPNLENRPNYADTIRKIVVVWTLSTESDLRYSEYMNIISKLSEALVRFSNR